MNSTDGLCQGSPGVFVRDILLIGLQLWTGLDGLVGHIQPMGHQLIITGLCLLNRNFSRTHTTNQGVKWISLLVCFINRMNSVNHHIVSRSDSDAALTSHRAEMFSDVN